MTAVDLRPAHRTPATMTDYQRTMAAALAPQTVACPKPKCNAQVGEWCRSAGGYQNSAVGFHAARKALVAHLSESERVAVFAAMENERDRRRAEIQAQMRRNDADPVYLAQRDASRKWWNDQIAEVDARIHAEEFDFRARCTDNPFRGQRSHADDCHCKPTGVVEYTPAWIEAGRIEALRGTLPVTDLASRRARRGASTGNEVA